MLNKFNTISFRDAGMLMYLDQHRHITSRQRRAIVEKLSPSAREVFESLEWPKMIGKRRPSKRTAKEER